jgi:hypothetical protein
VLTHLDNGLANPILILTQGKNHPLGKGSVLYCRITDFLGREGDTTKGCFEAHSLPSTVDSWNYEEKQGLAHMEFKVAVLFCGKSVAKVIRARRSSFEGKNNTLMKSCVL